MNSFVWVFVGAGTGGALRHGANLLWRRALESTTTLHLALSTFVVNVLGALIIGLVAGYVATRGSEPSWRTFVSTGVLGGFTTFSAFSLETAQMLQRGQLALAAGYALGSVAACVGAAALGMSLAR